jgi:hypothetical protein
MTLSRRHFLSIGLATAATALLPTAVLAAANAEAGGYRGQVYVLASGSAYDSAFAAGLSSAACRSHGCPLSLDTSLLENWGGLVGSLQKLQGARVLGIMDEWRYGLFEEALREVGAAILCQGLHVGSQLTRHHFVSLPVSQGVGATLAQALAAQGQPVFIEEKALHEAIPVSPRALPARLQQRDWPAMTAEILEQVATDRWQIAAVHDLPLRADQFAAITQASDAAPTSRQVSFVVQL